MKIILLSWLTFFSVISGIAQTNFKTFSLYAVAEGNFGTPNGDVFNVSTEFSSTPETAGPFYKNANSVLGIDVLQDFQIVGDKAILLSKANTYKVIVVNYPSFTNVATFTNLGAPQTLTDAGENKAYVSSSNPTGVHQINLANNTTSPVIDPANAINSYSDYMLYANGAVYIVISGKIVKVDVATNTVTSVIQPNIGSIVGIQYDAENQNVWLLGKVSGTSTLVKMDVANNDFLNTPITLTGVTNASKLRYAQHKLYFLAGTNVHSYKINEPNIPTTSIYTSTLTAGFGFAYGKSFAVDPASGDFAIGTANNFSLDSSYEVVDGTSYQLIETGSITGCKIVNELSLKTFSKLGIDDNAITANYVVYPNPAKNILNISLDTNTTHSTYSVTLINSWGATVKQANNTNTNSTIDVSDLASGIYFAQIKEANSAKSIVKKVVITH